MELKTKVHAEPGKQDLHITREFDLPIDLLFKAFAEADLVAQWMGTKVLKLESKKHGSYQYETTDPQGNIVFQANGVIHEFKPEQKITRTFEMPNAPFGVQMEIYTFESLTDNTSKLTSHVIYESAALRDQVLQLPFAQGLDWAYGRLEQTMAQMK